MIIEEQSLENVLLLKPEVFKDKRGYFFESYRNSVFKENNFSIEFVQDNEVFSKNAGVIRGLHYQIPPYKGAKLVRCSRGKIWDVTLDLRPNSKTFKEWYGVELLYDNYKANYVPEGCAHAYQTLEDDSEVFYLNAQIYNLDSEKGIRYSDPAFNILFPLDVTEISKKDSSWKLFES